MHGVLTEKVKPCNILMQKYFTLPFSMPTYGREREYFLLFQNQKFPNNNLEQIKEKQQFPNSFLFSESNQKGKSLFS